MGRDSIDSLHDLEVFLYTVEPARAFEPPTIRRAQAEAVLRRGVADCLSGRRARASRVRHDRASAGVPQLSRAPRGQGDHARRTKGPPSVTDGSRRGAGCGTPSQSPRWLEYHANVASARCSVFFV